jgi:ATP-dependent DNA ligase
MFGRRAPVYVAFDVLFADRENVRGAPLKERRAILASTVRRYRLQRCEPALGEGIAAFKAVCDLDLEGIITKRLNDPYWLRAGR